MSPECFDVLLTRVGPLVSKKCTKFRETISPAERLVLTVRYLTSGNSQLSMSFVYLIGRTTVSNIIKETCNAIWMALKDEYVRPPNRPE